MHVVSEFSHHRGAAQLAMKGLHREVRQLVEVPDMGMARGKARIINTTVRQRMSDRGWALDPRVHVDYKLIINGLKHRVGLTVQTGNITRAFYDLMKFEVMYKGGRIDAAVLIVPTSGAARALGSNIANFTRVANELELFQPIVSVPCLVLGIDESEGGDKYGSK